MTDIHELKTKEFKKKETVFKLNETLMEIYNIFKLQMEAKNIRFEICLSPELPEFVETDSRRLQQVLFNLVNNAFKNTIQGKVTITVNFNPGEKLL